MAHPRVIKQTTPTNPIERRLIEQHTTTASCNKKLKATPFAGEGIGIGLIDSYCKGGQEGGSYALQGLVGSFHALLESLKGEAFSGRGDQF